MRYRLMATAFLILLPAVFAATPVDLTIAVPGVAVTVAIFLGIMTMMASATSDPRLEAWVKIEIREYVAALILVGIVVGAFIGSNTIAAALGGGSNYVESSLAVLDKWISSYDSAFEYAIRAAAKIRVGATYAPYLSVPLWFVGINYATSPLAGTAIILLPLNLAAGALTNATYVTEGMRMMIVFVLVTGPPILLPLSLCLRIIPFSRKLGNTMIAVSIAGLVLLPAGVLIADALNGTVAVPSPTMDLSIIDPKPWAMSVFQPICSAVVLRAILGLTDVLFAVVVCLPLLLIPIVGAAAYAACYPIVQNVVYPILMVIFQLINTILVITWEISFASGGDEKYATAIFNQVQPFLRDVNNLVLLGYMDFIIIGIITVVGARSLSSALGGEWYMAGVQRLI